MTEPEPERRLVRLALPLSIPALALAFAAGLPFGTYAALSATIGVAVVFANFALHGASLAWAARISLTVLFAVGLGGFVVRMASILVAMFLLNSLPWFSPVAFGAAVVPCTIALLVFEMRQLASKKTQADLWSFQGGEA